MIDAQTYVAHVSDAGERITRDAEGNLDTTVPSCPEMTVSQLVGHIAEFSHWVAGIVTTGQPAPPGGTEAGDDTLGDCRREHAALVQALNAAGPDDPAWTWSTGQDRKRFWYRRAAQELAVHSWDVGNAAGRALPIDPTLAADGVSEMFEAFGSPNVVGFDTVAKVFDQGDRAMRLETTDTGDTWTFKQAGDLFDFSATDPEVTARASASDLLLFLWGRKGQDVLDIDGDPELLSRWQERVKI
jgi:uncharacterized protein (TIGR03083 family)